MSMGCSTGLDPSSFPSSLPLLLTQNTRGAEGGAGWRALFLQNRTKNIWHHASKVIKLSTKEEKEEEEELWVQREGPT
jgi:hypothetical protein